MLNLGLWRLHEGVREQSTIRMAGFGDQDSTGWQSCPNRQSESCADFLDM